MESRENEYDPAGLRQKLSELTGVEHVVFDSDLREAWLVLRSDVDPHRTEAAADGILAGADVRVCAAFRPEHRDRQRVRFVDLRRTVQPDQQIAFRVVLEWAGNEYAAEAAGGKGDAIELRTVASAALAAADAVTEDQLHIRLAGVKQVRAFDAELVVVSLYRADARPRNLVGAVVAGDDPRRGAAVAVLSALNRLMGNYLTLP